MPPTVYTIPPPKSHANAAGVREFKICPNARTQVHPIPIYKTEETHFGHYTKNILIIIPTAAIPQTRRQSPIPTLPFSTRRQIGV